MEQNSYPSLDDVFALYEQDHPKPASVTPGIPQGQQLGTIDKLAQAVIPRLVDKLNLANWEIQKLREICDYQQTCIADLYKSFNTETLAWLNQADDRFKALEEAQPKKKSATRRKSKKPAVQEADISEIADYDPDTDTWGPIEIDGHKITGALLATVRDLGSAASQMYSDELLSFLDKLEDHVKTGIAERFPN